MRGIDIPNFSALNQFVNPLAEFGKFATDYGNTVRAEQAAAADRMYRERQAQTQIDQYNTNHQLDLDKFAETKKVNDANILNQQGHLTLEQAYKGEQIKQSKYLRDMSEKDNKLVGDAIGTRTSIPFKDTVDPSQTHAAKNAAIVVKAMQGYDSLISDASKAGDKAKVAQLTKDKNNYGLTLANDLAKVADSQDNALVSDPNYGGNVQTLMSTSGASSETLLKLAKDLASSGSGSSSFTPEQQIQIAKAGINPNGKKPNAVIEELSKKQKPITPSKVTPGAGMNKLVDIFKTNLAGKPQRRSEVADKYNAKRLDAVAKHLKPSLYATNPEAAKAYVVEHVIAPQLNTEIGEWADFTNSVPFAPTEVDDAYDNIFKEHGISPVKN